MPVVHVARPRAVVFVLAAGLLLASMALVRPADALGSASISGLVTDRDGQPVAGADVEVSDPGVGVRTSLSTDGDGRFVADGLPAGRYRVCFYPAGEDLALECWEDKERHYEWTPVEVGEGQLVTGIDAELEPAIHLRGTVTDDRGAPAAGVRVSATWYLNDEDNLIGCCNTAVTAEDGSFDIGPLDSGEYSLGFSDKEQNRYASEWWDDASTAAAATHFQAPRGESVDHLDAVLADLAHVAGRVRGADGASASGTLVRVFRFNEVDAYHQVGSGSPLAADGGYEIAGLQPGTYRLAFDAAPGKYRTEYWNDARSLGTARDVVITGTTAVTGLDATLAVAPPVLSTSRPTILGRARVGQRLRVTNGAWDVPSLRFAYQWRADGAIIPSAPGRRLLLTPRLRGKHIKVRVTATATAHERSPGVAWTRRTQPVAPAPK